jgi:ABC-type transport system substrate-binding protein
MTEAAYQELDQQKRQDMYMKLQEMLVAESVHIPLVSMYRNIAVKAGVNGLRRDVRGTYRYLQDVWLEPSAR